MCTADMYFFLLLSYETKLIFEIVLVHEQSVEADECVPRTAFSSEWILE